VTPRSTLDPPRPPDDQVSVAEAADLAGHLRTQLSGVIAGRQVAIDTAIACLLAGGHLLIEDVPGVGKTVLAHSLATSVGGTFRRIQGTADLLPGDVVGGLAPAADGITLQFRPGLVFANVVMFDELNRANPRTQSALLEVMEEGQVSIDGVSTPLPAPFLVIATQNSLDIVGTYRLGEVAADRFMASISLGRATPDEELAVVTGKAGRAQLRNLVPIASPDTIVRARRSADSVQVSDPVGRFVVDLLGATRAHPQVVLGASTRAGVAWVQMAKAVAAMDGRTFVTPHDVVGTAHATIAHRLLLVDNATRDREHGVRRRAVIDDCLAAVPAPRR
jgi:MoxR-like ATPase